MATVFATAAAPARAGRFAGSARALRAAAPAAGAGRASLSVVAAAKDRALWCARARPAARKDTRRLPCRLHRSSCTATLARFLQATSPSDAICAAG